MPVSRRGFIRQTLVVGPVTLAFWIETDWASAQGAECTLPNPGTALPFVPNEPRIVTRFSAAELTDPSRATQLKQFRDAIKIVRNLPATNVVSWTKQIAQHCIHCASSNADNIHFNWQFLPWHRGLLYFLERVLRKLSGHDDLRLPYWDWENSASRTLPSIYVPSGQPLFWSNRHLTGPDWPLSNADVSVQGLLSVPTFRVFGGTATQGAPTPATFSGPHANVHNAFAPGDMADLQFSPRDPVFYAHHGNIDRLWSSWVAAGHQNPDFGSAKVFFYDENKKWRSILFNDLRNEAKLGYKYSSLMTPRVPVGPMTLFSMARVGPQMRMQTEALERIRRSGPHFLVIENVKKLETLAQDAVRYGIFSGRPEVGTQSATARGFLGKLSRVQSSGHDHRGPLSGVLDVTEKAQPLAEETGGVVDLYVAPLDAEGKTTAPAIPLEADELSLLD